MELTIRSLNLNQEMGLFATQEYLIKSSKIFSLAWIASNTTPISVSFKVIIIGKSVIKCTFYDELGSKNGDMSYFATKLDYI